MDVGVPHRLLPEHSLHISGRQFQREKCVSAQIFHRKKTYFMAIHLESGHATCVVCFFFAKLVTRASSMIYTPVSIKNHCPT